MKGLMICVLATMWVIGVIFYMSRAIPCLSCHGIDPRYNHTNAEGEWVPCDRCRGSGSEPSLLPRR